MSKDVESVWMYKGSDGEWKPFTNEQHRLNTIADGGWDVREFFAAPPVQGEPVGWQFYESGKWWNGDDRIKDHRKNTEAAGVPVRDVYASPQPGIPETLTQEQQPVPDVSALVDALVWYSEQVSGCRKTTIEGEQCRASLDRDGGAIARAALDAYRKQGAQS